MPIYNDDSFVRNEFQSFWRGPLSTKSDDFEYTPDESLEELEDEDWEETDGDFEWVEFEGTCEWCGCWSCNFTL